MERRTLSALAIAVFMPGLSCTPSETRHPPAGSSELDDPSPTNRAPKPGSGPGLGPAPLSPGGSDWPQYRFNPAGTWENPGSVTRAEAAATAPAWMTPLGEYGWTQPIIAGDTVIATTGFTGRVVALDASTGAVRWTRDLNHVFTAACDPEPKHHGFYSAAAIDGDQVYAASPDGNLYALDISTGSTLWQVRVANPGFHAEFVQSSPALSRAVGKVFLGVASSFKCDPVEGRVLSVDLSSREVVARNLNSPGVTGSSVWSSIAIDEAGSRIYVTTGDPAGRQLSEVPLSQAFVAMDANTLEPLDHWQNPGPGPNDNSDFGASPTLFTAGDGTELIAAPNKDGVLYVMRRNALSAGPVWTYQLAVGGNPLKGESSLVAPTFTHGMLIAGGGKTPQGEPGSVVAFDPGTGALKWKHVTPGFVIAAMPAVGDILLVVSNASDFSWSKLEMLDVNDGSAVKVFDAQGATLGAPSVGRGLVLWYQYSGELHALRIPDLP
jgi:outer membrane protein assembly factor BamB